VDYVLKHNNEFERLEEQAKLPNYDYRFELSDILFKPNDSVLDACCGSGVVSRYISGLVPDGDVTGIDLGEDNLIKAKEASNSEGLHNVAFQVGDATSLDFNNNHFDKVICRYAIQHISADKRAQALDEFYRVLKPGGELIVIDFDGTLYNLSPRNEFISSCFDKIKEKNIIDLRIGRKLPSMVVNAGFKQSEHRIDCLNFLDNGLNEEVNQLEKRFENAKDFLTLCLGTEFTYKRFCEEFFSILKSPGSVYFYNKFIVRGIK